jgi:large subunit ribosomal protein L9
MKVILLQDVQHTGKQGEVVTVSDGYARNFLFPRKVAIAAEGGALKNLEIKKVLEDRRSDKILHRAEREQAMLSEKTVTLFARSGEGKLYGRITAQDIADAVEKTFGIKLDKRKIHLENPIKARGDYQVPLRLHKDVIVSLKVAVLAEA